MDWKSIAIYLCTTLLCQLLTYMPDRFSQHTDLFVPWPRYSFYCVSNEIDHFLKSQKIHCQWPNLVIVDVVVPSLTASICSNQRVCYSIFVSDSFTFSCICSNQRVCYSIFCFFHLFLLLLLGTYRGILIGKGPFLHFPVSGAEFLSLLVAVQH